MFPERETSILIPHAHGVVFLNGDEFSAAFVVKVKNGFGLVRKTDRCNSCGGGLASNSDRGGNASTSTSNTSSNASKRGDWKGDSLRSISDVEHEHLSRRGAYGSEPTLAGDTQTRRQLRQRRHAHHLPSVQGPIAIIEFK